MQIEKNILSRDTCASSQHLVTKQHIDSKYFFGFAKYLELSLFSFRKYLTCSQQNFATQIAQDSSDLGLKIETFTRKFNTLKSHDDSGPAVNILRLCNHSWEQWLPFYKNFYIVGIMKVEGTWPRPLGYRDCLAMNSKLIWIHNTNMMQGFY